MSVHFSIRAATMSEQSEHEQTENSAGPSNRTQGPSDQAPPAKKHGVSKTSVNKWIRENDKTLSTATWLKFDTDAANRGVVVALRCSVCKQFRDKLVGMRNYNSAYVKGSSNLRSSSFKDHASTEMHARAMQILKKQVRLCT